MRTAVIYSRVSTKNQAEEGTSLTSQAEACRHYADEHGYVVLESISDDVSGATLERKGIQRVREMARDGILGAVICYTIDRLSRDLGDVLTLDKELERLGVGLHFVLDEREDTPQGTLFFQMKAVIGQYERTVIAERLLRGRRTRAREGKIMGSHFTAYGYRYNRESRTYEVHEAEAEVVRQMFHWVANEGLTMRAVARRLNKLGVPTVRSAESWGPTAVRSILRNELYTGVWHYNKRRSMLPRKRRPGAAASRRPNSKTRAVLRPRDEWIAVPVPALITSEMFQTVEEIFQEHKDQATRNTKRDYLLTGMVYCNQCRSRMYARWQGTNGYYVCSSTFLHAGSARCGAKWVRASTLEQVVWAEVGRQLTDQKLLNRLRKDAERESGRAHTAGSPRAQIEHERQRLQRRAEALKEEARRLLDKYLAQVITDELFTERMGATRRNEEAVVRDLADLAKREETLNVSRRVVEALERKAQFQQAGLAAVSFAQRRASLIGLLLTIFVDSESVTMDGPVVEVTLPLPATPRKKYELKRHQNKGA